MVYLGGGRDGGFWGVEVMEEGAGLIDDYGLQGASFRGSEV